MSKAQDTPLTTRACSDAAPLRAKLGALARAGPGHVVPLLRAKPATSVSYTHLTLPTIYSV